MSRKTRNVVSNVGTDAYRRYLLGGSQAVKHHPELRALGADTDVAGGYLVPPPRQLDAISNGRIARNPVRRLASVFPLEKPTAKAAAPALESGEAASWVTDEDGTISFDSTTETGSRNFTPRVMQAAFRASATLVRQSAGMAERFVSAEVARRFASLEEAAFVNGTGVGQPLGVFQASGNGISTDRDVASGSATGCTATGLRNAAAELGSDYWENSVWLMHPDFWFKKILELKTTDSAPIIDGEGMTLLSRPVILSDRAPSTFTDGNYAAVLGDFEAGYWIVDSPITPSGVPAEYIGIQVLAELFAASNEIGFIGESEVDGMPVEEAAFVRVKCSA